MKKINIIKKSSEFTNIIHNCPYQKNNYLIIYFKPNKLEINHYGISVPTKTGKAHIRNKIKRQLKDIIDKNEKIIPKSFDYVIIVRKRLLELNYQEININLITLMKKIGEKNAKK